jgi:sugar phosphate isomerase/epimerase
MASSGIRRRDFLKAASALAAAAAVGLDRTGGIVAARGTEAPQSKASAPTRRRFSLAYLTVFGCPPPEQTYIAARAGYDYVSFRPIYMGLAGEPNFDLAANAQLLKQTRTALATTGLRVLDIEVARVEDKLDPKKYLPAMEVGATLGARHVIAGIWTEDRVFATECYAQLCDLAKPLGLTIDLEFVTFSKLRTLQEAMGVLRTVRRENCGLLVDTLHFSRSRVALAELDAVPREWFHFVHVCDGPAEIPTTNEGLIQTARQERLYPGEGGIDIAGILKHLPDVPCSIELPHLARVKEIGNAEHAFRCLQTTKEYLDAHLRG